jgi:disulfide bond formation protein DsbB
VSTDTVTLFFALLATAAQVAVVVALVAAMAAAAGVARRWGVGVADSIAPSAPALAAVVALVATAGSLYLSEVAHFVPCNLCWVQRAAMYPIGPLVLVALWRRWRWPLAVSFGLAVAGAGVASYHVALERWPSLEGGFCDPDNPCTLIWVRHFGYLTIPGMALSGFALVATLLAVAHARRHAVAS